jgi:dUTP pyrophosphatase
MKVKIKKLHSDAVIPTYAKQGDAGMDLTAVQWNTSERYVEYDTGLSMEIPEGHVGLLFPRSSVSKTNLVLANCVGVVDSGYRGPVKLRFKELSGPPGGRYKQGDRVGQIVIMPVPTFEFEEVENLSDTSRGDGGFGSTGN